MKILNLSCHPAVYLNLYSPLSLGQMPHFSGNCHAHLSHNVDNCILTVNIGNTSLKGRLSFDLVWIQGVPRNLTEARRPESRP